MKISPSKKRRTLDFDSPTSDNKSLKRLIDRISCTKNIINPPNGALESPTQTSGNIFPQSLNLRLFSMDPEERNANDRISKANGSSPKGSPHKTSWMFQRGHSLSLDERVGACFRKHLNSLEISKDSSVEYSGFLNFELARAGSENGY